VSGSLTSAFVVACALLCGSSSTEAGGTRQPSAPAHIETWAYTDSCHGVGPAQTSLVRRWVTFAETKCATDHRLAPADCHAGSRSYCTSISYIDPNLDWSGQAALGMAVPSCTRAKGDRSRCANERWFVHKTGYHDRRHRLRWTSPSLGSAYLLNDADPSLDRFVVGHARRSLSAFDGLMVDDVGASTAEQLFGDSHPIYTSSTELHSNAAVQHAHVMLADKLASSFLQVDNGLSVNPYTLPEFVLLNRPAAVAGVVAEGYPENNSNDSLASFYSTGLDDIAYLEHTPRLSRDFLVLLGYNRSGSPVARRVQQATVMLGFEPGRIVDWAALAQNRPGLAVWPEEGLYFSGALQTMRMPSGARCMNGLGGPCAHGHADLQVASGTNTDEQPGGAGVYRREFRRCFLDGAPIGGCAAIVNDTDRRVVISRAWLQQGYRHQLRMVGGELQDGGHLTVDGAGFSTGATTIGADDAALLSQ
jgi:hypothetical protein